MKTLEKFALGVITVASLLSAGCKDNPKYNDLVKISTTEDRLWNIKNQKDLDGDRLVNGVSWDKLLYNAYKANGVDNAKDLSNVILRQGYVNLLREDINPMYNLDR